MSILLSLQGGMAAGKSTAARFAENALPWLVVDYENPIPVWKEVERLGLFENTCENFVARQRMFMEWELKRRDRAVERGGVTLFDLGAEEIEFFSLFYPMSLGFDWDVETLLAPELAALRSRRPDAVLYLDATHETLTSRRAYDSEKKRGFFDHFISKMADNKRSWFASYPNTIFHDVTDQHPDEVGNTVVAWTNKFREEST